MVKLNAKRTNGRNSGRFGAKDSSDFTSNKKYDKFGRPRKPRQRDGQHRRDRPVEMHKVVCDECGADCEVPFKPTAGKPVLCSDCFKKKGGNRPRNGAIDLAPIHEKLDKIMKALKIE